MDVLPVLKQKGVVSLDGLILLSETDWSSMIESVEKSSNLELKLKKVANIIQSGKHDKNSPGSDSSEGVGWFFINILWILFKGASNCVCYDCLVHHRTMPCTC